LGVDALATAAPPEAVLANAPVPAPAPAAAAEAATLAGFAGLVPARAPTATGAVGADVSTRSWKGAPRDGSPLAAAVPLATTAVDAAAGFPAGGLAGALPRLATAGVVSAGAAAAEVAGGRGAGAASAGAVASLRLAAASSRALCRLSSRLRMASGTVAGTTAVLLKSSRGVRSRSMPTVPTIQNCCCKRLPTPYPVLAQVSPFSPGQGSQQAAAAQVACGAAPVDLCMRSSRCRTVFGRALRHASARSQGRERVWVPSGIFKVVMFCVCSGG
jgi:hypothetical protein